MKITRDIVIDLWPLYLSGEASADTRALVDEFLAQDPEFSHSLREDASVELLQPVVPLSLSPDLEMQAFSRTRIALLRRDWPLFFALLFSALAFGRIVSDTSWDVSPRAFVVTAASAVVFWVLFLISLVRRLAALR